MSQPGLSRLVERVEAELGAKIFARGRSGAVATREGEQVLAFALDVLAAYETLRASIGNGAGDASRVTEVLKVVASTTPGEYLLPGIASEFSRLHPAISVESMITDSRGVTDQLLSGECHAGFAGTESETEGLKHVPIAKDEIVLAVAVSHRFAELDEINVEMLEGERMLRRESGSGTYEVVAHVLAQHGMALPREQSALTLGSTQAVVSAVDAGLGVGFVTKRAIEHHAPSRVKAVRIKGVPVIRNLFLVYEPGRQLPANAQAFIEFVQQRAQHGDGWA